MSPSRYRTFLVALFACLTLAVGASVTAADVIPIEADSTSSPDADCEAVARSSSSGAELAEKLQSCSGTSNGVPDTSDINLFTFADEARRQFDGYVPPEFGRDPKGSDGDDNCGDQLSVIMGDPLEDGRAYTCGAEFRDGLQLEYTLTIVGNGDGSYGGEVTDPKVRTGGPPITTNSEFVDSLDSGMSGPTIGLLVSAFLVAVGLATYGFVRIRRRANNGNGPGAA